MRMQNLPAACAAFAALLAASLLTGCATSTTGATASSPDITASTGDGKLPKKADLLFVQNARGATYRNGRLTLRGVNPQTIAFADRPVRFAGHMPTSHFVPMWGQGKDSFLKDPPNATLSVLSGGKVASSVLVLRNPRYADGDLSYDVQVLENTPPADGAAASLFIDIIGMPRTPYSFAGAARRGAYYGRGYYGPTVVHYGAPVVGAPCYGPTVVHYGPYGTTVVHRW